ncbi:LysR family transcriptional regulator [Clostridium sp. KNHs205]|uniref:LysR family transcriptional regulator n=1 Tax=Clostridium sp. KNHs205 TaxID=1449050 RepID=UPI00051C2C1F|nr:LysR family transcriptional regulator [Clostridium sp. KNHs205]
MYNRQLDTFIQVADAGSFSKAADELYISATAVIKQINLLESSLDLQLFERSHRGLTLTESGKSLYNDSKYIIQYSNDSIMRAKKAMVNSESIIRIGTSLMTPTQFLMELRPQIHEHYPELKFQLVPFDNTPENAREILMNLGQNIDIVAGVFDNGFLKARKCTALELSREPICCAVPIHHKLASKSQLTIEDLYNENVMMIKRGWNSYIDLLRDDLWQNHSSINIVDFSFYSVDVFNECENSNNILLVINRWTNIHPLMKIIPVSWSHAVPFGLLYSPSPSAQVQSLIDSVAQVYELKK